MTDAMENLEFEIASEFSDTDNEESFDKGAIDFDLNVVEVEGNDFDAHEFLKSLGAVSQSNTGKLARAMEQMLKVVHSQSALIKGLSDRIDNLGKSPSSSKAALTPEMAKAMSGQIVDRPFSVIGGSDDSDTDGSGVIGPYKERIRKALIKGIEAMEIDSESALTVLGMPDNTPISSVLKSVKSEVRSIIESATKAQ